MKVDEVRSSLRSQLEEAFGVDEATLLMDGPAGGWDNLATKQDLDVLDQRIGGLDQRIGGVEQRIDGLDRRFDALDQSLRAEFSALRSEMTAHSASLRIELHQELRNQTWRTMTATFTVMAILVAAMGMFVTLAKL